MRIYAFILWTITYFILVENSFSQSVGISSSGATPHSSSILDLSSSSKGFLLPRMTTTERDAISSPALGLQIFNTTDNCLQIYINGSWQSSFCDLNCSAAPATPGTITGTAGQCENATNQTFYIAPIPGATSYNWTVPSGATITAGQGTSGIIITMGSNAGNVAVTASNNCGTSAASSLAISILNAPTITVHPSNVSGTIGGNATFTVTATGDGLTYQWQEDPNTGSFANVSNGGSGPAYSGATTASLTLTSTPAGYESYKYRCVVSGSCSPSVTSNSATLSFCSNQWNAVQNLGGVARRGAVAFDIGTKGYIGTGYDGSVTLNDFWEYDPGSDSWTQKANFGGAIRDRAVGFSIDTDGNNVTDKGYIGTGATGSTFRTDFWEYDPGTNSWTQKTNYGNGITTHEAMGFSIGTKGYLGTGDEVNGAGGQSNKFWEYDPIGNTWTQKANFGGGNRHHMNAFAVGGKGYAGLGYNGSSWQNDFWEYDPVGNSWTQKANYTGASRGIGGAFALGSKGYFGGGYNGSAALNEFYEYDPAGDSWTQKTNVGGSIRMRPVGFAIDLDGDGTYDNGYIGTGRDGGSNYHQDIWKYCP